MTCVVWCVAVPLLCKWVSVFFVMCALMPKKNLGFYMEKGIITQYKYLAYMICALLSIVNLLIRCGCLLHRTFTTQKGTIQVLSFSVYFLKTVTNLKHKVKSGGNLPEVQIGADLLTTEIFSSSGRIKRYTSRIFTQIRIMTVGGEIDPAWLPLHCILIITFEQNPLHCNSWPKVMFVIQNALSKIAF
jgi:hypothetical protein